MIPVTVLTVSAPVFVFCSLLYIFFFTLLRFGVLLTAFIHFFFLLILVTLLNGTAWL